MKMDIEQEVLNNDTQKNDNGNIGYSQRTHKKSQTEKQEEKGNSISIHFLHVITLGIVVWVTIVTSWFNTVL